MILPTDNDRNKPWGKTKEALAYLAEHHINEADWFLRADDNSFVVMENLRYMLYPYPSNLPLYFSSNFMIQPEAEAVSIYSIFTYITVISLKPYNVCVENR